MFSSRAKARSLQWPASWQSNYATVEPKFQIRVAPDFQRTYTGRLEITAKEKSSCQPTPPPPKRH